MLSLLYSYMCRRWSSRTVFVASILGHLSQPKAHFWHIPQPKAHSDNLNYGPLQVPLYSDTKFTPATEIRQCCSSARRHGRGHEERHRVGAPARQRHCLPATPEHGILAGMHNLRGELCPNVKFHTHTLFVYKLQNLHTRLFYLNLSDTQIPKMNGVALNYCCSPWHHGMWMCNAL